jgi:hypothetical protein
MIEIKSGTLEERIIKILQKTYPITVKEVKDKLNLSNVVILRVLNKLQIKGILVLEILPDKTFIRLLRHDFSFVGKKRQRKFKKHSSSKKQQKKDYDGDMYA